MKPGNWLSSEYLVNYTSYQNPSTKVAVAVSVKGFRAVRIAYKTPALPSFPAAPYKPSAVNNGSSPSTSCSWSRSCSRC